MSSIRDYCPDCKKMGWECTCRADGERERQARTRARAALARPSPEPSDAMLLAGAEVRRRQRLERYQNQAVASDQSIDEEESREIYLAMIAAMQPVTDGGEA